MEDESTSVQVEAAEDAIELLGCIEKNINLLPTDFNIFKQYIFEAFTQFSKKQSHYSILTYCKNIGKLAVYAKRYIEQGVIAHLKYLNDVVLQESAIKGERRNSQEIIAASADNSVSNFERELGEIFKQMEDFLMDLQTRIPLIFQSALVKHAPE